MRALTLAGGAVLAALVAAPVASASPVKLSVDSPATPAVAPSQDIRHVASAFDDATGTWTVAVTLAAAPSSSDWGDLAVVLWPRGDGRHACADPSTTELARFAGARTNPASTAVYGTSTVGGAHAAATVTKDFAPDGVTLTLTDPSLVGQAPGCLKIALSHNALLDAVGPVAFDGEAAPAAPAGDVPDDGGAPAAPTAFRVAFPSSDARLKASSSGTVRVALRPLSAPASGTVTLKAADGSGRTLGRGTFSAQEGRSISVRVQLTVAARRTLARGHRLDVRIAATATTAAGRSTTATRTARITARASAPAVDFATATR